MWLNAIFSASILIDVFGLLFPNSLMGLTAFFSMYFAFFFFGTQILFYLYNFLMVEANPWLITVKRMEGFYNPMYMPWLFEHEKRTWAAKVTLLGSALTPVFGFAFLYLLAGERLRMENVFTGLCLGSVFQAFLALCWYKGFWKKRTPEPSAEVPDAIKAKWLDKNL